MEEACVLCVEENELFVPLRCAPERIAAQPLSGDERDKRRVSLACF